MPMLDAPTLTLLLCTQLGVMALALTLIMHGHGSPALRWAVGGLWVQLASWLLVAATPWLGFAAVALSFVLGALCFSMSLQAVSLWLGPMRGLALMQGAAWVLPLALLALMPWAVERLWMHRGLGNGVQALCLVLLLLRLMGPTQRAGVRWRWVMAVPLLGLLPLLLVRAVHGLLESTDYPTLTGSHPVAQSLLVLGNLATIVSALGFLAAWRGEAEAALREVAQSDALTGLANRRRLEERATELIARARRHARPLCALVLDLDHFKQVNDRHGHAAGDASLRLFAELLRAASRPGDCAARLGGEEFVVLLEDSDGHGAHAFDQRLRQLLRAQAPPRLGFPLDYSAGWTPLNEGDHHVHDLLQRADAALYRAKHEGRGRLADAVAGA